jgi:hypothetical protein
VAAAMTLTTGRLAASCSSRYVLTHNTWMARGNPQEREGSALRLSAILLQVAKRVHANAERLGELRLRQPNEPTQRRHIARLKLSANDALTLAATKGPLEIGSAEFRDAFHDRSSMYSR